MKQLDTITGILTIVGGINWGLRGALNFDVVANLFGGEKKLGSRIVYSLVGASALYRLGAMPWKKHRSAFNYIRDKIKHEEIA